MIEISKILAVLAEKRAIFHSEADFQHALAWEIHKKLPKASVRLELPVPAENKTYHIDVWIKNPGEFLAVELKYKTRRLSVKIGDEQFSLKNQSAQDTGRYDFIYDIQRLEHVAQERENFTGYAILLTNDSSYWKEPASKNTVDADFRINEGKAALAGSLNWTANASDGTKKNREQILALGNSYPIKWEYFSQPSPESYGLFRYLAIKVSK